VGRLIVNKLTAVSSNIIWKEERSG